MCSLCSLLSAALSCPPSPCLSPYSHLTGLTRFPMALSASACSWSTGGDIALLLAALHGGRVGRVIALGAMGGGNRTVLPDLPDIFDPASFSRLSLTQQVRAWLAANIPPSLPQLLSTTLAGLVWRLPSVWASSSLHPHARSDPAAGRLAARHTRRRAALPSHSASNRHSASNLALRSCRWRCCFPPRTRHSRAGCASTSGLWCGCLMR